MLPLRSVDQPWSSQTVEVLSSNCSPLTSVSLSGSCFWTTLSSTCLKWSTSWAAPTCSPPPWCRVSPWTRPPTSRRSSGTRYQWPGRKPADLPQPLHLHFPFILDRSVSRFSSCAWGSSLSSSTCRRIQTGPTFSLILRLTRSVLAMSRIIFYFLAHNHHCHLQVSLLDFGATRGFDKSFTDDYIEVRRVQYFLIHFFNVNKYLFSAL